MKILLKMLFKFVVLIVVIAGAALGGKGQNIPPCCPHPIIECQPIHCAKPPCCTLPPPPPPNTLH